MSPDEIVAAVAVSFPSAIAGQYRWFAHSKVMDHVAVEHARNAPRPESIDQVFEVMQDELASVRAHKADSPLGVFFRSPVFDPSGYAEDARHAIKCLAESDRELSVEEIKWSDSGASFSYGAF
jgi:hypothetical protein